MRRRGVAALLTLCLLFMAGCTDFYSINQVAFALGVAIDRTADGRLLVTLQFPLPGLKKGGGRAEAGQVEFFLVTGEGDSFPAALMDSQTELARPLSFGHLQVVLISEELARNGLDTVLEQLWRLAELDKLSYLLVTEGQAADVLSLVPPQDRVPALYLNTAMTTIERTRTQIHPATLMNALVMRQEYGRDLVTTALRIDNGRIVLDRLALFNRVEMVGMLSPEESLGLLIALGQAANFVLTLQENGETWVIRRAKTEQQTAWVERLPGGAYRLALTLRVDGEVGGMKEPGTEIDREYLRLLEQRAATEVHGLVIRSIQRLQELQVDPVGFFSRTYGSLESDELWREAFRKATPDVLVSVRLSQKGTID